MRSLVSVRQVAAQPIAAVRARMAAREIPSRFKEPLDKVWAFLGRHPELRAGGHNLFLYHHDMDVSGAMLHASNRMRSISSRLMSSPVLL